MIPPRPLRDQGHQIPGCSFTQCTGWSCFILLNLIPFLPQTRSFFFRYVFFLSLFPTTLAPPSPGSPISSEVCLFVSLAATSAQPSAEGSGWRGGCHGPAAVVPTERQPEVPSETAVFHSSNLNIVALWIVFPPPGLVLLGAKT